MCGCVKHFCLHTSTESWRVFAQKISLLFSFISGTPAKSLGAGERDYHMPFECVGVVSWKEVGNSLTNKIFAKWKKKLTIREHPRGPRSFRCPHHLRSWRRFRWGIRTRGPLPPSRCSTCGNHRGGRDAKTIQRLKSLQRQGSQILRRPLWTSQQWIITSVANSTATKLTHPRCGTRAPDRPTCKHEPHGRRRVRGSTGSETPLRSSSSRKRRTWRRPRRFRTVADNGSFQLGALPEGSGNLIN